MSSSQTYQRKHVLLSMGIYGIWYSTSAVAVGILLGSRFGPGPVGLVLAVGILGRLLATQVEKKHLLGVLAERVALAVLTTIFLVLSAYIAPWWVTALVTIPAACASSLVTTAVMHEGRDFMHLSSASTMLGQAVGLVLGGFSRALSEPVAVLVAQGMALTIALVPVVFNSSTKYSTVSPPDTPTEGKTPRPVYAFFFALASYGPLALLTTLISKDLGSEWVGPAYVSYAAGSFVAVPLSKRIPLSLSSSALLASLASLVWCTGLHSAVFVLFGRFFSGVLLFTAQGALLARAASSGRLSLSRTLSAIGVGSQLSAFWCGQIASVSVPTMGLASALAALLLAILTHFKKYPRLPESTVQQSQCAP